MSLMQKFIPLAAIVALTCAHASEIRDTQDELIAWVETKKAISETANDWLAEKEIVSDLIQLLEIEKEKLTGGIEKLEDTSDATDTKRADLNADKEMLVASTEAIEVFIPELEASVKALLAQLPEPLVEELDPLIRRLPEAEGETRLPVSQRLLTVVGILNKIDKFNTGISVDTSIRNVGDTSSEVTTIYFGLAGAFFANDSGTYAGVGTPGSTGWDWKEDTTLSKGIVALIASYAGTKEAKFVELPVTAK